MSSLKWTVLGQTSNFKKLDLGQLSKKKKNYHSLVYPYFKICNNKKGTMWIIRHIFFMYTHICNYKKNYVYYYSLVYPYFKICNYEKGTVWIIRHIFFMYTHICSYKRGTMWIMRHTFL